MTSRPRVIGHRGFPARAPENTLAAFLLAMEAGADGIELDVHQSRDGRLVVCHDPTLDRTTDGRGLIAAHTWEELRRLDAGSWFGPEFRGEPLPSLDDVLALVRERAWPGTLNIELANLPVPYPGIEEAVAELLAGYGLMQQSLVSSFDHASLERLRRRFPGVKTACLLAARLVGAPEYARALGCAAVHPHAAGVTPEYVAAFHQAGLLVHAWAVEGEADLRRVAAAGVDGVITDDVALARAVLGLDAPVPHIPDA